MGRDSRHMVGAFAAMLFVGASWGANLPVTKVMLRHFDLEFALRDLSTVYGRNNLTRRCFSCLGVTSRHADSDR